MTRLSRLYILHIIKEGWWRKKRRDELIRLLGIFTFVVKNFFVEKLTTILKTEYLTIFMPNYIFVFHGITKSFNSFVHWNLEEDVILSFLTLSHVLLFSNYFVHTSSTFWLVNFHHSLSKILEKLDEFLFYQSASEFWIEVFYLLNGQQRYKWFW